MQNNKFPKQNNYKLLQKRHRTSGPQVTDKESSVERPDYHQFEKNMQRMNPRMNGSKNPRLDKLDKKMTAQSQQMNQNQMVQ